MITAIPNSFSIDRKTTNAIKGTALVLMFIHHFFTFPDWLIDGIDYWWLGSFAEYFNAPTKLCVAIFAFLTGYFYYSSNKKTFRNSLKKATDLWLVYLLVFFVMLIPALYFNVYERSVVKFVAEAVTLYTPTMSFCWYVPFYMIVVLLLPFLSKISEKNSVLAVLLVVTVPFALCYVHLIIRNGPLAIFYNIIEDLSWLPCVLSGYLFAQYNLFDKMYDFCRSHKTFGYIIIQLLCMLLPFFSRYYTTKFDIFYAPMFIFGLVNLVNLVRRKWLLSPLYTIGKYSLPMWLLHGAFFNTCKEYTQWILYYPKNPILVLLWGLALCLFVSVIIMFPINLLVKIKNKLFFK